MDRERYAAMTAPLVLAQVLFGAEATVPAYVGGIVLDFEGPVADADPVPASMIADFEAQTYEFGAPETPPDPNAGTYVTGADLVLPWGMGMDFEEAMHPGEPGGLSGQLLVADFENQWFVVENYPPTAALVIDFEAATTYAVLVLDFEGDAYEYDDPVNSQPGTYENGTADAVLSGAELQTNPPYWIGEIQVGRPDESRLGAIVLNEGVLT